MFTQEELQEFKDIYFEEFGEKISDEQAFEYANSLVSLIESVYKE